MDDFNDSYTSGEELNGSEEEDIEDEGMRGDEYGDDVRAWRVECGSIAEDW